MPRIAYGSGAYRRTNGNMPEFRLINMFVEAAPDEAGAILLSRKGLTENAEVGSGPINGLFKADGVFDGDLFARSGTALYRGSTLLGEVPGEGVVSIAASRTDAGVGEMAIATGATLYRYNEPSGLDAVSFPDGQSVIKILFHDGLFIAIPAQSQRYYWSAVLSADSWNSIDFTSAERAPDQILDAAILNDTAWFFGSDTIEPHANTGDPDAPYQRFEQRIFSKGIHSTGCVAECDNSLLFVGSDSMVYRLSDVPERISDHGIEERIGASATVSVFAFTHEGHAFFCVRLDTGTFAYDVATRQWCEFQTYGRSNFRARCAEMDGDAPIFGDDETGKTWTLSGYDDDGDPLLRLFTLGFPINGGTVTVDSVQIEANVGWTDLLSGQGSAPVAELRMSRDTGATWGNWRSASLGAQGSYRTRTNWRRNGTFDFPGALGEVRTTDPVPFRISGVYVNEPGGGRSR